MQSPLCISSLVLILAAFFYWGAGHSLWLKVSIFEICPSHVHPEHSPALARLVDELASPAAGQASKGQQGLLWGASASFGTTPTFQAASHCFCQGQNPRLWSRKPLL